MGCAASTTTTRRAPRTYVDNGSTSPTDDEDAVLYDELNDYRSETSKGSVVTEPGAITLFATMQAKVIRARFMHGITSDADQFKDDDNMSQVRLVKLQLRIRRWLSRTTLPLPWSTLEADVGDQTTASIDKSTAMYSSLGLPSAHASDDEENPDEAECEDAVAPRPMAAEEPIITEAPRHTSSSQQQQGDVNIPGSLPDTEAPKHKTVDPMLHNSLSARARGNLLLGRQRVIRPAVTPPSALLDKSTSYNPPPSKSVFLSAEALAMHARLVRGV